MPRTFFTLHPDGSLCISRFPSPSSTPSHSSTARLPPSPSSTTHLPPSSSSVHVSHSIAPSSTAHSLTHPRDSLVVTDKLMCSHIAPKSSKVGSVQLHPWHFEARNAGNEPFVNELPPQVLSEDPVAFTPDPLDFMCVCIPTADSANLSQVPEIPSLCLCAVEYVTHGHPTSMHVSGTMTGFTASHVLGGGCGDQLDTSRAIPNGNTCTSYVATFTLSYQSSLTEPQSLVRAAWSTQGRRRWKCHAGCCLVLSRMSST